MRYIRALGAEDSTQGFVEALKKDSYFKERLFYAKLPILDLKIDVKFDIIVCIAVIMHLTKDELRVWIEDVKNYLATNAKIIISYSPKLRTNDELRDIFLDVGVKVVDEVVSFDGGGESLGAIFYYS